MFDGKKEKRRQSPEVVDPVPLNILLSSISVHLVKFVQKRGAENLKDGTPTYGD